MVNRDVVMKRLDRLKEYLAFLEKVRTLGFKRFCDDPFVRGAGERYLQLSIECLLDIGNHIIADEGWEKPENYRDVFPLLAEKKVISSTMLKKVERMASFRNMLVHDYIKLDEKIIFEMIDKRLSDVSALAAAFGRCV